MEMKRSERANFKCVRSTRTGGGHAGQPRPATERRVMPEGRCHAVESPHPALDPLAQRLRASMRRRESLQRRAADRIQRERRNVVVFRPAVS
ncbi:hypothetical protein ANCCEY_03614 [Ancylostoma ceylanicum]|uniref:Uncharacterized protein n=1 Tax=Ancylostoma ceylanicum TaxID=53326 RepID=A0A0D6MB12_9BILA|nr:hypothetical protein ANCCEY_03614 [Ancylostoma ceylanicum]